MSRRKLLSALAAGAGAGAVAAAAWPFAAGFFQPLEAPQASEAPWIPVAAESELRKGAPLRAALRAPVRDGFFTQLVDLGAVYLLAGPPLLALSAVCPHLGCGIAPASGGAAPGDGFVCPCHDSRFSSTGEVLRGPSPRAMDPLPVRVVAGRIEVQALRFASGGASRRPI
jgi:Rieske Fe-S protein